MRSRVDKALRPMFGVAVGVVSGTVIWLFLIGLLVILAEALRK